MRIVRIDKQDVDLFVLSRQQLLDLRISVEDSINSIRDQIQKAHQEEVQGRPPELAWFRSAVAAKHAKGTIVQAIQARLSWLKGAPGALTLEGCFMTVARRRLTPQVLRDYLDEARGLLVQEETA